MRNIVLTGILGVLILTPFLAVFAQIEESELATTSTSTAATSTARQIEIIATTTAPQRAPVLPEEQQVTAEVFKDRPIQDVTLLNFMAFFVQEAARLGVPTETIALILLLPLLVTIVAFVRNVIGLSTLDMLVPVTFAIAILASGFVIGIILLSTIVLSSMLARILLRKIRIMQLPRIALSMMIVSFAVLGILVLLAVEGTLEVQDISIVPILLLVLLSERIVRLQFEVAFFKTFMIVVTTLAIGTLGYLVLSVQDVREMVLLYPEIVLLLIPVNIFIGRYFGLRFTEYFRFGEIEEEE